MHRPGSRWTWQDLPLGAILEDGPLAVLACDRAGRIALWNDAAAGLFGHPSASVTGRPLRDAIMGDRGVTAQLFEDVVSTGRPASAEVRGRRGDGSGFVIQLVVAPWARSDTGPAGGIGFAIDQTAQADTQKRLAEIAAEVTAEAGVLHAVLANVPLELHLLDPAGRYLFASPLVTCRPDVDATELVGHSVRSLPADPVFKSEIERLRHQTMRERTGLRSELTVATPVGQRTVECLVNPIIGTDGAPRAVLACVSDVSQRKADQAALQGAYVVLSQLIANTPLASIEWGADRRIRRWSERARALFGWTGAEAVGRDLDELNLVDAEDRAGTVDAHRSLIEGDLLHNVVDQRNRSRSDKILICRWYNSIVRTGDGQDFIVLSLIEDVTEQQVAGERIRQMAEQDPLTKLPNRTLFRDRLDQALARARRSGAPGALLLVDLDHFKEVNDSLGHQVGDQLLIEVACRLRDALRASDTVARLGGDEFALILPDLDSAEAAAAVAQKVLEAIRTPVHLEDDEIRIGASIGATIFPDDGRDHDMLFRNADLALYRAKGGGRDACVFYTSAMDRRVESHRRLVHDLRGALSSDQLELLYQPQFTTDGRRLVGLEALLRWRHPTRGVVRPETFLPAAERSGLIRPLGTLVIERACAQLATWADQGRAVPRMAINVSRTECERLDLVEVLLALAAGHGVPPALLEVEIGEGALLETGDALIAILGRLTSAGIGVVLEDFGSGPASLTQLARLPFSRIKLSPALIRTALEQPAGEALVDGIVSFGHRFGRAVIATGIETPAARDFALRLGCDAVQGDLLGAPMAAADIASLLPAAGGEAKRNAD